MLMVIRPYQVLIHTWLCDRSSAVAGPRLWNMLPASLCLVDDFTCVKCLLKAYLCDCGCGTWWLNVLTHSLLLMLWQTLKMKVRRRCCGHWVTWLYTLITCVRQTVLWSTSTLPLNTLWLWLSCMLSRLASTRWFTLVTPLLLECL